VARAQPLLPPTPPQDSALNLSYFNWAAFGGGAGGANVYYNPYSSVVARRRIVEYRINYFGPQSVLDAVGWAAAPFGDASAQLLQRAHAASRSQPSLRRQPTSCPSRP